MARFSAPKILLGLGLLVVIGYVLSDLVFTDDQYLLRLKKERVAKNDQFRAANSPLPEAEHDKFDSLRYFPAQAAWRLPARLERLPAGDTLRLPLTQGGDDKFTRFARATFQWQGQPYTVTLLRRVSKTDSTLFVPFTDATNGRGSYGGGRYLDVETPAPGDDEAVLDFNRAYNPYCAYGGNFSCPMPPKENWLTIEVPAGEKNYKE